jgi:hypothetical protein
MAKKSGRKKKKKQPASQGGPMVQPRNIVYMALLGVLLGGWVIWRLEPSQGLAKALLWGGLLAGGWWIFVGLYYRSMRGNDQDE